MKSLLAVFVLAGATAFAGAITTVGQIDGITVNAVDITGATTNGNEMGGMTITGLFASGSSAVCTWANGAGTAGGCTSVGGGANSFQLALDGDTFSVNWNLSAIMGANLLSLAFDGLPGFTVFDRTNPSLGTSGSSSGFDAAGSTSPLDVDGSVTYINQVATLGGLPVGDIFAQVLIEFDNGGLPAGSIAAFRMDADSLGLRGGTPGSGVPEPSTFGLLGLGLLGLGWFRRSRT